MATYFLDSSALVKRYVSETGSNWVDGLMEPSAGHTIFLVDLTRVEIVAALTRRGRGGTVSPADAALACTQFRTDLATDYQVFPVTAALVSYAMTLAESYGLRAYDAIQLAALEVNAQYLAGGLPALTLVSADAELNAAASAEELTVEDPNTHL